VIVGTAGHIDHGKTALVRAITGVDTDRLPEEKRRGISIALGYAFLPGPGDASIGFVDVPGHERLVHTMLAGATGFDVLMLVVAADDGVMPQTREHVAIASLLGVRRAVVVVNKCDRADDARRAATRAQARDLLRGTGFDDAPVCETSAVTGAGVAALRGWLLEQAAQAEAPAEAAAAFRMPIDRVFTLRGLGTVVTGTVAAGGIAPGDEVALGAQGRRARIRSVHAQGREAARARAGQRCALNLAGVDAEQVGRGDWATDPAVSLATDRLDVALVAWAGADAPLRSGTPVHLHVGAADVTARVVLLDGTALAPGGHTRAQLVAQRPVGAWRGDRIVLRDAGATRTLAGGTVLDPFAPARHRASPPRLAVLDAYARPDQDARLAALALACPDGVDGAAFLRAGGLLAGGDGGASGRLVRVGAPAAPWLLDPGHWRALIEAVPEGLAAFHAREPVAPGVDAGRLRRLLRPRMAPAVFAGAIEALLGDGRIVRQGAFLRLPAHAAALSEAEERLALRMLPRIAAGGFEPPWVRDLAAALDVPEAVVRGALGRLGQRGDVHLVVRDLYYAAQAVERLAAIARGLADAHGEVRAAAFRDAAGIGRNRAVQILESFDRVGLLRRAGPGHRLREGAPPLGLDRPGT
jgi:selenocysteine-specific elongation factor